MTEQYITQVFRDPLLCQEGLAVHLDENNEIGRVLWAKGFPPWRSDLPPDRCRVLVTSPIIYRSWPE